MTGGCAAAAGGVVGSSLGPGVAGGCASAAGVVAVETSLSVTEIHKNVANYV